MTADTRRNQYLQRWTALDNEFSSWRAHYQDIANYVLPRSGRFFTTDNKQDQSKYNKIYDNTGTLALATLSAGLMAGMTSPARPWFRLTTPDPSLAQSEPVKLWLNAVTRLMQTIFARSNTYRALHSVYEELGAFGTAASIVVEDFDNVIHHHALTAGEYRLASDDKGNVDTLYREFQFTVGQHVQRFGKDKVSQAALNLYNAGNYDTRIPVIHLIEPRRDRDYRKSDGINMPWRSLYFEKGSDNPDSYLRESGYKRFPVLAPRWTERLGDVYGISPAMMTLGDIKQLQHQQLRKAQGIDYQVRPPVVMPTSAKNSPSDFLPGGISYADTATQNGVRSAFEVNINLQYLLEDIRDVRDRINSGFFADLFKMLAMSDRRQMTATEVAERHEEKLLMLGPVLERQHNELLDPKIELTFARMLEAGIVPPPPPDLQGAELQVEFVSMLAQAQRAVGVNAVDRLVMSIGTIAALKPDVADKLNGDELIDQYSDMLGVDPNIIVADDKVAIIRSNRAKQQQAAQTAALAESASKSASNLAGADTSGKNALTDVTKMFSGYTQ